MDNHDDYPTEWLVGENSGWYPLSLRLMEENNREPIVIVLGMLPILLETTFGIETRLVNLFQTASRDIRDNHNNSSKQDAAEVMAVVEETMELEAI